MKCERTSKEENREFGRSASREGKGERGAGVGERETEDGTRSRKKTPLHAGER